MIGNLSGEGGKFFMDLAYDEVHMKWIKIIVTKNGKKEKIKVSKEGSMVAIIFFATNIIFD